MKKAVFFLIILLLAGGPVLAQTRYVSDELVVTMRRGEGESYKILKMLKANTPVDVLQEVGDYFLVQTQDGTEGYVLKQYLTTQTPKPLVIARLERENQKLQERLRELEGRQSELKADLEGTRKSQAAGEGALAARETELQELRRQYESLKEKSRKVIEITDERDELQVLNDQLATEASTLREENEQMLFAGAIKWFMAGGGVFLFGWITGKVSRKKKRGF